MTQPTETATATDATLDKIRAILELAERAGTPAEAEAATAKAMELMSKYGVNEALLAAKNRKDQSIRNLRIDVPAPYARDKRDLIAGIALALDCKVVYHQHGRDIALTIIGFASDVETIEILYTSLLVQAAFALASEDLPEWWETSQKAAYRRSWYSGYTARVATRLELGRLEAKQAAEDSDAGTALVWVSRSDALERAMADQFGKLRTFPQRRLTGSGAYDGARAGDRANLGTTKSLDEEGRQALA